MLKKMSVSATQEVSGGVGSGWYDSSVTKNTSGGVQVDINAFDGGTIRYEYTPPEKMTTTTEFGVSWNLKDRTLEIPGLSSGTISTGVTRTYYPPTQDGSYQVYRDGERFLY